MELQQFYERTLWKHDREDPQGPESATVARAFRERFEMLDECAPSWYTKEPHNRALQAVRILQKSPYSSDRAERDH